jgi:putative two-component system response regulator
MLTFGKQIARHHHEKWDGSGYPDGLAGAAIPLSARLMAVADVYDALISVRPYKKAMTHDEALAFIRDGSGSHFDPRVVEALNDCLDEVRAIASRWAD